MKKLIYASLLSVLLSACSTNMLTLSVTQAPAVGIPSDVQKVGIVHRTKSNSVLDKLDRVLSLESKSLERDGEKEVLAGLKSELLQARRFEEILELNNVHFTSVGMGVMSKALSWPEVESVCKANNVDVLFVLEMYDTDTRVDVNRQVDVVQTRHGDRAVVRTDANMNTSVRSGWRVYDPLAKLVVDEYSFSQSHNFNSNRVNPLTAVVGVVNRDQAVLDMSYSAGAQYAHRFLPHDIRVSRDYYVKGTDNFEVAKRLAQTGKWNEAAEYWQKETVNADSKIAGRAYYNMAIVSEINGKLDLAIDWASKAYEKFGNKKALNYISILRDRQNQEQKLKDLNMK